MLCPPGTRAFLQHAVIPPRAEESLRISGEKRVLPARGRCFVLSEKSVRPACFAVALQITLQSGVRRGVAGLDRAEYLAPAGGSSDRIDTGAARRRVCPGASSSA